MKRSFRATAVFAVVFGISCVAGGIVISAIWNLATSGVIIFTSAGLFILVALYRRLG